jgi:hypothetical protein
MYREDVKKGFFLVVEIAYAAKGKECMMLWCMDGCTTLEENDDIQHLYEYMS